MAYSISLAKNQKRNMDIKHIEFPIPGQAHQKILFDLERKGTTINFGTVFLEKGRRIPDEGYSKHPQHEISYIHTGRIQILNEDGSKAVILKSGDIVSLEAFEPQAGLVLEDTKIIYLLIGWIDEKNKQ